MSEIRFGTAGQSDHFKQVSGKMGRVPEYIHSMGLNAFEYQCGRGVRLGAEVAEILAQKGQEYDIQYSLHAPYYISMSSMEQEKRLGSIRYILESAAAVRMLGGKRVIFHAGSCGKQSREQALEKAKDTLQRMQQALDKEGFREIILCPETMGKINQLGSLEEVLTLCEVDKRITPCIDFGHLNARTLGGIKGKKEYAEILDTIEYALQDERATHFHVHFSKIEYTNGGEKCHLTFEDTTFGPFYEPLMELFYERKIEPVIICESAGTQDYDAQSMMQYYKNCCE